MRRTILPILLTSCNHGYTVKGHEACVRAEETKYTHHMTCAEMATVAYECRHQAPLFQYDEVIAICPTAAECEQKCNEARGKKR